jgi:hypothetical protein
LEQAIDELLGLICRASTLEVCTRLSTIWMRQGPEVVKEHGLSSPVRQTFYLQGLLMTTPEPDNGYTLTADEWARVLVLLNAITDSYMTAAMASVIACDVDAEKVMVAQAGFLQRFMSGRLAVAEQIERLIVGLCVPFDDRLRADVGISATEVLEMTNWLRDALTERWQRTAESMAEMKRLHGMFGKMIRAEPAMNIERFRKSDEFRAAEPAMKAFHDGIVHPNCVLVSDLEAAFGKHRSDAFLRLFALRRGGVSGFRYFASPIPQNPAENAPLVILDDDGAEKERVCAPMHAMLYNAVYDVFDDILRKSAVAERYLKNRADYLEERANSLVGSLFPNATLAINKYYETERAENEHDGLLLAGSSLIVLEEKASEMKTPSRDIARCYRNLSDHFKSNRGIQHAYDQAVNVVNLVEGAAEPVSFYDEHGRVLATIEPGTVEEILILCVTLEIFGGLAVDLTMLLDVSAGRPYPVVMNLYDLETLIDAFHSKGLTGHDFLRYLRERRAVQGRLLSDDELNIAGKFIVDGKLPNPSDDTVMFIADYADLFDDLFFQKHGVESNLMAGVVPGGVQIDLRESLRQDRPVFVGSPSPAAAPASARVGRNKKCRCGSHRMFKACCGRAV